WRELAGKIKSLINTPDSAREYAKNAKALVEQKFSIKTTARQLADYYRSILKAHRQCPAVKQIRP
ncbi:MAG: hypothetical protein KKH68_05970, partial [Proteobacteria bacterium]|nr:hypothetical protein [Pseudomonadota bacterium]